MPAPVPARDHANMTVSEREFTFDALLAEFAEPEASAASVAAPAPAAAPLVAPAAAPLVAPAAAAAPPVAPAAPAPQPRRVPDAAAVSSAPAKRSLAQASAARASAPSSRTEAAPARVAAKPRRARRRLSLPSDEILKFGGLVVVAGISLTLAFVALSR